MNAAVDIAVTESAMHEAQRCNARKALHEGRVIEDIDLDTCHSLQVPPFYHASSARFLPLTSGRDDTLRAIALSVARRMTTSPSNAMPRARFILARRFHHSHRRICRVECKRRAKSATPRATQRAKLPTKVLPTATKSASRHVKRARRRSAGVEPSAAADESLTDAARLRNACTKFLLA